jgi:hypothetical protein
MLMVAILFVSAIVSHADRGIYSGYTVLWNVFLVLLRRLSRGFSTFMSTFRFSVFFGLVGCADITISSSD